MGLEVENEIALAVVLTALEDYYMEPVADGDTTRDPVEVENNRESARVFFFGDQSESMYWLYAEMLGVPALSPDIIAQNLRKSGRKMGGRIKRMAMVNIIGEW